MKKCVFCKLNESEKIIFHTKNFTFIESKFPLIKGHCLLISKRHIRKEGEIPQKQLKEYHTLSIKAFKFIKKTYRFDPLIFINPPEQQSVLHFHKHFIPGIFGVNGVETALKNFLRSRKSH